MKRTHKYCTPRNPYKSPTVASVKQQYRSHIIYEVRRVKRSREMESAPLSLRHLGPPPF